MPIFSFSSQADEEIAYELSYLEWEGSLGKDNISVKYYEAI
jgi:hypothetical protein